MCGPLCCCVFTPLDTLLQNKGVEESKRKNIVRAAALVTALSVVVFAGGGLMAGIGIVDAMCPGHGCTGTTDFKSIFTTALPFIATGIGAIAPCVLVRLGGQAAGLCMGQRDYMQIQSSN